MINYEIEVNLPRSKVCILSEIFKTPEIDANPASNPNVGHAPAASTTSLLFKKNITKLYVPVIALTIKDNIKFLENLM